MRARGRQRVIVMIGVVALALLTAGSAGAADDEAVTPRAALSEEPGVLDPHTYSARTRYRTRARLCSQRTLRLRRGKRADVAGNTLPTIGVDVGELGAVARTPGTGVALWLARVAERRADAEWHLRDPRTRDPAPIACVRHHRRRRRRRRGRTG
ncbi:MAG: hypothetical protein ACRD0K_21950 [Egibacteraceae bacterium]